MAKELPKYLSGPDSETAVVFIHGLGGSYSTWNSFANALQREWKESDIYALEYDDYYNNVKNIPLYTFFIKSFFGQGIEQLSKHLDSFIKTICESYKNVILVCHSMGGLIARKYIINLLNRDRNVGKVKALITYATPHLGSSFANVVKAILHKPLSIFELASLRLLTQIKDLSKGSELINSINEEWTILGVNSKLDFLRVVGYSDIIVNEDSAKLEDDYDKVFSFANKDHFSIIKPHPKIKDNALYVTYNYLKNFNKKLIEEAEESDEYTEENDLDY